jgi:preprotein translocase subunit YajC
MYGEVTRVKDKTVQLQVANNVRIEFARQAIGGYQGQEPVVPESGNA